MKTKIICWFFMLFLAAVSPVWAGGQQFAMGTAVTGLLQFNSGELGTPKKANGIGLYGEFENYLGASYEWVEAEVDGALLALDVYSGYYELTLDEYSILGGWGFGSAGLTCADCSNYYLGGSLNVYKLGFGYS